MHQIEKIGAFNVVMVYFLQHDQKSRGLLPDHLVKFCDDKKNKEYKFIRHVK